jgi:hypothetical protein
MTRIDENLRLSEEQAARTFRRAAELDGAAGRSLSVEQVRQIATEAGMSSRSVELALSELSAQLASGEAVPNLSRPAVGPPPRWVRFCMLGVPDRRIARVYYWLFLAGLIAIPLVWRLGTPAGPPGPTGFMPLFAMAFCGFALWSTSRTIRWLDLHGWNTLQQ